MGKKRRIMTSGQKFVNKYRSFLEKAGDAGEGGDTIINVPGRAPYVSALEVTDKGGRVVTFKALVENTDGLAAGEKIQVTLNGTAVAEIDLDDLGSEEDNTAVDGQTQTKGIIAWPVSAVPFAADDPLPDDGTDVYDSDWLNTDRVLLESAGTPAILPVGSNTLKVAIKSNNKARFAKTKTFTVADSKVTFDSDDAAFVAANGVDSDNIDVNLGAGDGPSGIAAGDKTAWSLANNKYKVEVTTAADTSTNLALSDVGTGGRGNLTQKAGQAADTILTVVKGGAGITDILANELADTELVVTITPFNKKGQEDTASAVSVNVTTGAGA